ncbi:MAG TPA: CHRD domain-containing protein, partial [Caldilineaceae bacterium]|nr:CHRD domain-containing protein [Caldilineaceae bacterium]
NTLHVHVAVTNTSGITMAHIHRGPVEGAGGVIHGLYASSDGPFDDHTPLIRDLRFGSRDLVDLLSGWFYVNVHTTAHLGGEIRGQIGTQRAFRALLNGANERPNPVTTDASGLGTLVLSGDASELHYRVAVTDITDIRMAHIHVGGAEVAGPVRHTLWNNGPGLFDPSNPISGVVSLSVSDLLHLAGGAFYINVHTQQNGSGEIRGQIEPYQPFTSFQSLLSEAAEVSATALDAEARGLAAFQLNEYPVSALQYEISVSDIPTTTLAHIHKGLPGVDGPPVFTLTSEEGRLTPARPLSGAVLLDAGQLLDLLTGYYYVNVHTVEKPGGQIRGQLDVDVTVTVVTLPLIISKPGP